MLNEKYFIAIENYSFAPFWWQSAGCWWWFWPRWWWCRVEGRCLPPCTCKYFLKSEYKNIYIVKIFIPEDVGCGGASLRGAAQRQRVALWTVEDKSHQMSGILRITATLSNTFYTCSHGGAGGDDGGPGPHQHRHRHLAPGGSDSGYRSLDWLLWQLATAC